MFTQEEIIEATRARGIGKALPQNFRFRSVCQHSRKISTGDLFVAIQGERFDGHQFLKEAFSAGAAAAIIRAGHVDPREFSQYLLFEVEDTVQALGDLAHTYRKKMSIPVIGVTGSNGKTTTKDLIARLLTLKFRVFKTTGNLNNLIGVPFTLFELKPTDEIAVIEMGMSIPFEIKRLSEMVEPTAGLITNIGEAHLLTMGSKAKIAEAKGALFLSLGKEGMAFINLDDPFLSPFVKKLSKRCAIVTYGLAVASADVKGEIVENRGIEGIRMKCLWKEEAIEFHFPLAGEHNALSAVAAIAVAIHYGIDIQQLKPVLESFSATEGRSRIMKLKNGSYLIDDSYNANPSSVSAALEMLDQCSKRDGGKPLKKIAVLGDMLELGGGEIPLHEQIGEKLASIRVDYILTYGRLSQYIGESAVARDSGLTVYSTLDQGDLILKLKQIVKSEKACVILIKGSHGMHMERVVEALFDRVGKGE